MDAIMQALMGGDAMMDDEKMRQTADALRGAKEASDFFGISTIKPIARQARSRSSDIMEAAKRAGRARQLGLEKSRTRKLREKELADEIAARNAKIAREAAIRKEDQDREDAQRLQEHGWDIDKATKDRQNRLDVVQAKADAKAEEGGDYIPITPKDWQKKQEELTASGMQLAVLDQVLANPHMTTSDPTEGFRYKMGAYLPDALDVDEEAKQRQLDMTDYQRIYETPERHGFYGGALTKPEVLEYNKIKLLPTTDEESFKRRAQAMKNLIIRVAKRNYNKLRFQVKNKDQLRGAFADVIDYFVFDDKGKVVGLKGDFSNEKMMKEAKTTKDLEKQQKDQLKWKPAAKEQPQQQPALKKSVAAINGPNANAVVSDTPEGKKAIIAPDRTKDPQGFYRYLESLDNDTLYELKQKDPSIKEWIAEMEAKGASI